MRPTVMVLLVGVAAIGCKRRAEPAPTPVTTASAPPSASVAPVLATPFGAACAAQRTKNAAAWKSAGKKRVPQGADGETKECTPDESIVYVAREGKIARK